MVVLKGENGIYQGIAWNAGRNRSGRELELMVAFPAESGREYALITKTVDEETCNPLRVWHDLGEPASLTPKQKKLLKEAARPLVASNRVKAEKDNVQTKLHVKEFGVVYFELQPVMTRSDRGYDYGRVMQLRKERENEIRD